MTARTPHQKMLKDLRDSGLTEDAETNHISGPYSGEEIAEWLGFSGGRGIPDGYLFHYPDRNGKNLDEYVRAKLLDKYYDKDGALVSYLQEPGSKSRLYYPADVIASKILGDPSRRLYITEGEKKALALTKHGYPAIAVSGVWNWKSDGGPIKDFADIEWKGREVVIVFDSPDMRINHNVIRAANALEEYLFTLGARPFILELPHIRKQKKTGADDFFVHHKAKAKKLFDAVPLRSRYVPQGITFQELSEKKLPLPKMIVPGLLPVGLSILAGSPKIGKSWLMLQLAVAVSTPSKDAHFLNVKVAPCAVMYLALEDTERRFQDRLKKLKAVVAPGNGADFFNRWPTVENYGLEALERAIQDRQRRGLKLVIIDTLARMRTHPDRNKPLYDKDYEDIGQLKRIADDCGVAIVVVHHTRKAAADDPLDTVSGSTGLTGAADTVMVLKRGRGEADGVLHVTGRDIDEAELALRFEHGSWGFLGDAHEYRMSKERREIVDAIKQAGKPCTPTEVATALGHKRPAVQRMMQRMENDGELVNDSGKYSVRETARRSKIKG